MGDRTIVEISLLVTRDSVKTEDRAWPAYETAKPAANNARGNKP